MQPQSAASGPFAMLIPFLGMFLIFYLLVFQPQAKAKKAHQQMLARIQKNDEVVTSGGIIGVVVSVKQDTVMLRVDENVRIEVEKSAIVRLVKTKSAGAESNIGVMKS
jgi:preprotein translocase subunit YajC